MEYENFNCNMMTVELMASDQAVALCTILSPLAWGGVCPTALVFDSDPPSLVTGPLSGWHFHHLGLRAKAKMERSASFLAHTNTFLSASFTHCDSRTVHPLAASELLEL